MAEAEIVVRRENCKFVNVRRVVQAGLKARLYVIETTVGRSR